MVEKIKQKRGRKQKVVDFSNTITSLTTVDVLNQQQYILHLPIQLSDIEDISRNTLNIHQINKIKTEHNIISPFNYNNINIKDNVKDNNLTIYSQYNYTKNIYNTSDKDITIYNTTLLKTNAKSNQIIPQFTNIACWWCCHNFDWLPVHNPVKYNSKTDIFDVDGNFCSFNCVKSYLFDKNQASKNYLEVYLRKKLTDNFDNIKRAPSKYVLQMFGGPISIEEYRMSFTTLTEYNYSVYPMVFIPSELKEYRVKSTNNFIKKIINETKIPNKKVTMDDKIIIANKRSVSNSKNIKSNRTSNNLTKIMGIKIT